MTVRWSRHPAALWRRSAGRVVLLPPGDDEPVVLSATGAAIWEVLDRPRTTEQLTTDLAEVFQADPARIRADVEPFLDELHARGAIRAGADERAS